MKAIDNFILEATNEFGVGSTITEDQVTVTDDVLTFSGLAFSESNIKVNVTVAKSNIKSKVKEYKRSQEIEIVYSSKASSGSFLNLKIAFFLNSSTLSLPPAISLSAITVLLSLSSSTSISDPEFNCEVLSFASKTKSY